MKEKKKKKKFLKHHKKTQRTQVQKMTPGTEALVTVYLDLPDLVNEKKQLQFQEFHWPFISASFHSWVKSAALNSDAQN